MHLINSRNTPYKEDNQEKRKEHHQNQQHVHQVPNIESHVEKSQFQITQPEIRKIETANSYDSVSMNLHSPEFYSQNYPPLVPL